MLSTLALTASAFGHPGGWLWLLVLVPLFWFGLVALTVTLVGRRWRHAGHGPYGGPGHAGPWHYGSGARTAEATLASRFANGDIDEQEYRARLEVLRANGPVPPAA